MIILVQRRFPPAGRLVPQHPRVPGHAAPARNAGSNTFADHKEVLAAALKQVPPRFRRKVMVRVDGAGASHDLVEHLLSLTTRRMNVLFTTGWMITAADEEAIALIPAGARKPGTAQDGTAEEDKDVAEITHLLTGAGNWPGGLGFIVVRARAHREPAHPRSQDRNGHQTQNGSRHNQ